MPKMPASTAIAAALPVARGTDPKRRGNLSPRDAVVLHALELMEPRVRGASVDEATWTTAMSAFTDDRYVFVSPINFGAWGRKPTPQQS